MLYTILISTVLFTATRVKAAGREQARILIEAYPEARLMRTNPETRAYILPTAGSCFWRTIKSSGKLSAHSFGIALDLNARKGPC